MEELKKVKEERDFYHTKLMRVKEKVLQASERSWSRSKGTTPKVMSHKESPMITQVRPSELPTKDCGGFEQKSER